MSFDDFGLNAPIRETLSRLSLTAPTPIQAQAIPPALQGRDIVGIAQTGTGKTAAFSLPMLHLLAAEPTPKRRVIRALILAPTRELAAQINDAVFRLSKGLNLRVGFAIGGVPIRKQQRQIAQGLDILVATPGRLEDLLAQKSVTLDQVAHVVLDEADQMLDIGFIPAIRRILGQLPQGRQTMLFSATMPAPIRALMDDYLQDPVSIAVTPESTPVERIEQTVLHLDKAAKSAALLALLSADPAERVIVFARTKHGSDRIARSLQDAGIDAGAIHGNKTQGQRVRMLKAFREGDQRVLIATDIAARGIDISGIELVVNYDLPNVPETYVHRIGRTGRAGATGRAVTLCAPDEFKLLRAVQKVIRMDLPVGTLEGVETLAAPRAEGPGQPKPKPKAKPKRSTNPRRQSRQKVEAAVDDPGKPEDRTDGSPSGSKRRKGAGKPQNKKTEGRSKQGPGKQGAGKHADAGRGAKPNRRRRKTKQSHHAQG